MDHSSTDGGGGDSVCLVQSPPMSKSMVEREMRRIVQVLEELATTPLVDTRQITLVDLSVSDPELEGNADPVPRCTLFQSPEQPTGREPAAVTEGESWLISLASPAPAKAGVTLANTNQGAVLNDPVALPDLLGSPLLGETKLCTSEQPFLVEADSSSVCPTTADVLSVQKPLATSEEAVPVDSCVGEEGLAVPNAETTFAVPSVPAAPSATAATKKCLRMRHVQTTTDMGATDIAVTPVQGTIIPSVPAGQLTSALQDRLPTILLEEAAAEDSCASEEGLAVANAETTFAIPVVPAAPPVTAVPRKGTSDKVATSTAVAPEQDTVAHTPAAVRKEAAVSDSCSSEDGSEVANAETTFAVATMPTAPSVAAVPRKASSKAATAADTTATLGQGAIPRRPLGQPLPRRSMLPPPSQRAGRLSVPSRPTVPRGQLSVAPSAADTTFGVNRATPEGRLSAPKSALQQPSQRQAAPVSQPAPAVPGPRAPFLRRSVAGAPVGAAAASRRSLQAPVSGALASGVAKRGPAPRLSVVPVTAAASRTSLRPPAKPAATGPRKSLAGPQKVQTPAGQPTAQMAGQAPKANSQPQPKPKSALAPQQPRSRLPPPKTRVTGGLPRPAASRGAASSRAAPTLLLPIVESPVATRLSSTPVRSDAPLCGAPDLTPIRKR